MKVKAIFLDIDGTIIDCSRGDGKVSEKTKLAINKLKAQDIKVFICTGRSKCLLTNEILNLNVDGLICCNGVYGEYQKEIVFKKKMTCDLVKKIKEFATKNNCVYLLETENNLYTGDVENKLLKHFMEYWSMPDVVLNDDGDDTKYLIPMLVSPNERVCNIIEEELKDLCPPRKHANYNSYDLEPFGCTKGEGIKEMMKQLNIDLSDTMCFGDGYNDVDMFKTVKYPIAMFNAVSDIKEIACDICGDVLEDGVYHYLVKNKLID